MAREILSGSSERIVADSSYSAISGVLTISLWVYPLTASGTQTAFANGVTSGNTRMILLHHVPAGPWAIGAWGGGNNAFNTTLSTSTWTHLCVTRDSGNTVTGFVNGTAEASTFTITDDLGAGAWIVGSALGSSQSNPGNLRIAELAVWTAELSQAEIDALAAGFDPTLAGGARAFRGLNHFVDGNHQFDPVVGTTWTDTNSPTDEEHPRIIKRGMLQSIPVAPAAAATSPFWIELPARLTRQSLGRR